MTRFLMSLEESVDLVIHAFEHARPGDIFVRKAPACTIATLAEALQEMAGTRVETRIIGSRHGEKVYETLLSREEAAKAEDLGDYYRVPADTRDLNYEAYFEVGDTGITRSGEYTSHNTRRLNRSQLKQLLLGVDFIQNQLCSAPAR